MRDSENHLLIDGVHWFAATKEARRLAFEFATNPGNADAKICYAGEGIQLSQLTSMRDSGELAARNSAALSPMEIVERHIETQAGLVGLSVDEAREQIQHIAKMMDPVQRKAVARDIVASLEQIKRHHEGSADQIRRRAEAYQSICDWDGSRMILEKNDCSRLHRLREATAAGRLLTPGGEPEPAETVRHIDQIQQTFVVRHNWADAFEGAEGIDSDFCLPYQCCSFEFRISGRNLICITVDCERGRMYGSFIEAGDYWIRVDSGSADDLKSNFVQMMWNQVRAICIALDADVATSEVVRAPVKLNEKRAKAGKTPLPDYRVVDLARRHRVANPAATSPGTGTKKRLHFRRGHWRHFETSKTWVKWCLVGDPDLGFIAKHYRL